jgi:hypothetical protein
MTRNEQIERLDTIRERISELRKERDNFDASEHISEEDFLDLLNESYGSVTICGYDYDAGYALKRLDPIAFRCGFVDYCSEADVAELEPYREIEEELTALESELEDLEYELEAE